jgi:hypothetical protein
MTIPRALPLALASTVLLAAPAPGQDAGRIDRRALVTRHNPVLTAIDPASPLMVGNGNFAFTADITGLQTFQDRYSPRVPLLIQAQWAWHSFPNPAGYTLAQAEKPIDVRGTPRPYPYLENWDEARQPHVQWLRENPHRFSLGRLGLHLVHADGRAAAFADLAATRQALDLWTGRLESRFTFDGAIVDVETSVHPAIDAVIVRLRSPLLAAGRLGVDLKFPGVGRTLNPDPADWTNPDAHQTRVRQRGDRRLSLERQIDDTRYAVDVVADRAVRSEAAGPHAFRLVAPGGDTLTLVVAFGPQARRRLPAPEAARAAVAAAWHEHWTRGGVVDFSGSTDPRAAELERRVVLSQYLMAVNAAGEWPPQEEGLFSNSWNGKFHTEMHLWHAGHFALWGRPHLLERSMGFYRRQLPEARIRARARGAAGAWWPKMVGPEGRESPSTINPFLVWQQPHPIFLAELLYRANPGGDTLSRYRDVVFESARLLASLPHPDGDRLVLGPPLIPAQEVFPPLTTFNPTFELEYFRFGLQIAQEWLRRLGSERNLGWDRVIARLSPLPVKDGLYLATESTPQLWDQARSPQCSGGRTAPACLNRDHPSFVLALGLLPGDRVDRETMRRTFAAVLRDWDLRQTWGWDFPMLAMTAARLGLRDQAVEMLLGPAANFRFGAAGMTPRVQIDERGPAGGADRGAAPAYRTIADTYFPSNGALLWAVALMAGGWDGARAPHPGFPDDGTWKIRSEGLRRLP